MMKAKIGKAVKLSVCILAGTLISRAIGIDTGISVWGTWYWATVGILLGVFAR